MRKLIFFAVVLLVACTPAPPKFKEGDTVQLVSGSPTMTISGYYAGPSYGVSWIDRNGQEASSVFDEPMLRKVP